MGCCSSKKKQREKKSQTNDEDREEDHYTHRSQRGTAYDDDYDSRYHSHYRGQPSYRDSYSYRRDQPSYFSFKTRRSDHDRPRDRDYDPTTTSITVDGQTQDAGMELNYNQNQHQFCGTMLCCNPCADTSCAQGNFYQGQGQGQVQGGACYCSTNQFNCPPQQQQFFGQGQGQGPVLGTGGNMGMGYDSSSSPPIIGPTPSQNQNSVLPNPSSQNPMGYPNLSSNFNSTMDSSYDRSFYPPPPPPALSSYSQNFSPYGQSQQLQPILAPPLYAQPQPILQPPPPPVLLPPPTTSAPNTCQNNACPFKIMVLIPTGTNTC